MKAIRNLLAASTILAASAGCEGPNNITSQQETIADSGIIQDTTLSTRNSALSSVGEYNCEVLLLPTGGTYTTVLGDHEYEGCPPASEIPEGWTGPVVPEHIVGERTSMYYNIRAIEAGNRYCTFFVKGSGFDDTNNGHYRFALTYPNTPPFSYRNDSGYFEVIDYRSCGQNTLLENGRVVAHDSTTNYLYYNPDSPYYDYYYDNLLIPSNPDYVWNVIGFDDGTKISRSGEIQTIDIETGEVTNAGSIYPSGYESMFAENLTLVGGAELEDGTKVIITTLDYVRNDWLFVKFPDEPTWYYIYPDFEDLRSDPETAPIFDEMFPLRLQELFQSIMAAPIKIHPNLLNTEDLTPGEQCMALTMIENMYAYDDDNYLSDNPDGGSYFDYAIDPGRRLRIHARGLGFHVYEASAVGVLKCTYTPPTTGGGDAGDVGVPTDVDAGDVGVPTDVDTGDVGIPTDVDAGDVGVPTDVDAGDVGVPTDADAGDSTDTPDVADTTDSTDSSDATDVADATDSSDSADSSDATDTTDVADTTDSTDSSDATDVADTTDSTDSSDATDTTDVSDATDSSDAADTTDVTDVADSTDASDVVTVPDADADVTNVPDVIDAGNIADAVNEILEYTDPDANNTPRRKPNGGCSATQESVRDNLAAVLFVLGIMISSRKRKPSIQNKEF